MQIIILKNAPQGKQPRDSSFLCRGWEWRTGRQPGQETAQVCRSQRQALKPILRQSQQFHSHPSYTLKAISTVPPIFISFSKSFKIVLSAHYHKELKVTWSVLSQDEKRDRQGKCFIYTLNWMWKDL